MTAPVTIVSCLYGETYRKFLNEWVASISALATQPEAVLVATDQDLPRSFEIDTIVSPNHWRHPQAFYLQQAILAAESEWVWILDIDDTALPDALNGIACVQADVWQMGYQRSDGETHIPPQLTAAEYLNGNGNPFTAGSAIWRDAFTDCGGFPDVAFQDFGLWRRLAWIGATFQSSSRAHYRYNRHPDTRSEVELLNDRRQENMLEMLESELVRH